MDKKAMRALSNNPGQLRKATRSYRVSAEKDGVTQILGAMAVDESAAIQQVRAMLPEGWEVVGVA